MSFYKMSRGVSLTRPSRRRSRLVFRFGAWVGLVSALVVLQFAFAGCCSSNCPVESGTTFAEEVLAPSMQRPYADDRVFPSAGAGLWTTAHDQLKFYKMLMNLGVGDNGVRILKEDTVKSILAVSTRPKGLGGYSLGLTAPVEDGDDQCTGRMK